MYAAFLFFNAHGGFHHERWGFDSSSKESVGNESSAPEQKPELVDYLMQVHQTENSGVFLSIVSIAVTFKECSIIFCLKIVSGKLLNMMF